MLERADSPWNPTMRLFRQPTFGDWASVFREMTGEFIAGVRDGDGDDFRSIGGGVWPPSAGRVAAGREEIYRQILVAEPEHADAWHLLGVAAHQSGRNAEAVEAISRAVAIKGDQPAYLNHLGAAQWHWAIWRRPSRCFAARWRPTATTADSLQPRRHAEPGRGRSTEAIESYRRAWR